MEEVKVIYCYDENKTPIHYSKTIKGDKYFCIDCGSELICKDGKKKVKHLAHKNTEHCGGSGESIFHKHWKENLFKAGMFVNIGTKYSKSPENVEILEVLNEVSLCERYNKKWDNDIVVDVLLITEKGEIVVEINYKNAKDWDKLKPYYEQLNLLRVYEVTVNKSINTPLKWFCLGEEELIKKDIEYRHNLQKEKEKLIKQKKKEKKKLELDLEEMRKQSIKDALENGTYKKIKMLFNFKNTLQKINDKNYVITCLYEINDFKYEKITLKFDLSRFKIKEDKFNKNFKVSSGIKSCSIIINAKATGNSYDVLFLVDPKFEKYDKRLFAQLCNLDN
jgi:hypothetical protein